MAEIMVFHSVYGLRPAVRAAADRLSAAGHTVRVPDLFEGNTFDRIADGLAYRDELGSDVLTERAQRACAELPRAAVFLGFSLGASLGVRLAKRCAFSALVLLHDGTCVPEAARLPAQIHVAEPDEFVEEPDLVAWSGYGAQVFRYPGCSHLYTDDATAEHREADTAAARETWSRITAFLAERDRVAQGA
ncbi:dienelactone hydrolase family protein [Sciscionella marina]|uniref:dienelactone hydrolase family protein n=1 Tax=Sciscionella marina TaxID=508770 RepID=UPI000361297B|nr:dienelactone hydrolase family protein [Sciscionella marina]